MKLFTVLVVDRVHNKVIVNMSRVVMGHHQDLITGKVFGEPKTDFVRSFGSEVIIGSEGLHDVIIGSAVLFTVFLFYITEFFECCFGRTLNPAYESLLGCLISHYIRKDIIHRATRSNKFNDCHIALNSSLVSVRFASVTKPALTARVI